MKLSLCVNKAAFSSVKTVMEVRGGAKRGEGREVLYQEPDSKKWRERVIMTPGITVHDLEYTFQTQLQD